MYRNERIQNAGSMLQHLAGSFCRAISESLSPLSLIMFDRFHYFVVICKLVFDRNICIM